MKRLPLVLTVLFGGVFLAPLSGAQASTCPQISGGCPVYPTPIPRAAMTQRPPTPAPTARPATQAEMAAFLALAPSAPPSGAWALDEYAVAGRWALVGYYNDHSGMTALLQLNASGTWAVVRRGGGQILATDLTALAPAMPPSTAQALYRLALSEDH